MLPNKFINLHKGIGTLNLELPDFCRVGDVLKLEAIIGDRTMIQPFINHFEITVIQETVKKVGKHGPRIQPPGPGSGTDRDKPIGIQLPNYTKCYKNPKGDQKGWDVVSPPMTELSALCILYDGDFEEEDTKKIYDFFINMDNLYLRNEQKNSKKDEKILGACFLYGMILLGLALIHDHFKDKKSKRKNGDRDEGQDSNGGHVEDVEDKVGDVSRAFAPILLPMIDNLGSFEHEFDLSDSAAGEFTG
jgi:hypothetical protein